jgi:four helix bundle protein
MGGDAQGYRGLTAWQKAMDLCEEVYLLTSRLPDSERFGLVSQIQRAAISIPSNIAEGYGRGAGKDYAKHLRYAKGSLAELETQIELAVRCHRVAREDAKSAWHLAQEVGKLLTRLTQSQSR